MAEANSQLYHTTELASVRPLKLLSGLYVHGHEGLVIVDGEAQTVESLASSLLKPTVNLFPPPQWVRFQRAYLRLTAVICPSGDLNYDRLTFGADVDLGKAWIARGYDNLTPAGAPLASVALTSRTRQCTLTPAGHSGCGVEPSPHALSFFKMLSEHGSVFNGALVELVYSEKNTVEEVKCVLDAIGRAERLRGLMITSAKFPSNALTSAPLRPDAEKFQLLAHQAVLKSEVVVMDVHRHLKSVSYKSAWARIIIGNTIFSSFSTMSSS